MKFINFILCLSIILFACPAASEIYKYVDENGGTHFTDDFSKVPVEQRSAINAVIEYEDDSDTEQAAQTGVPDGTDEHITDDSTAGFTDDSEYQDEEHASADTVDEEQIDVLRDEPENKTELMASSDDAEAEIDLDAIRSQLEVMKKEIDGEYQGLVKEKEQLAKENKSLKGREEILKHNKKIDRLNKKVGVFEKKGKIYEARVEAYNEWVSQENTKAKKKTQTP